MSSLADALAGPVEAGDVPGLVGPVATGDDVVAAVRPITVADLLRSTSGHGLPADGRAPIAARLLAERLLRPLGMHDTGFHVPPSARDRTTALYRRGPDGALDLVDDAGGQWSSPRAFASGAGGWVSTAADLLAFHRMLLDGGRDVLPADLVGEMTSDQLTPAIRATNPTFLSGQSWGYGGGVDLEPTEPWNVPGRYGWVGGTGTSASCVPSDGSVAILLTQVELQGPADVATLETFWREAARRLGHDRRP